jgi:hypothetical protein
MTVLITISKSEEYYTFDDDMVFIGTPAQFATKFFSNVSAKLIIQYCIASGWDVHFYDVPTNEVKNFCFEYGNMPDPYYWEVFDFPALEGANNDV